MIYTLKALIGKEVQIQPLVNGGIMIFMPPYFGATCHKIVEIDDTHIITESQRHSAGKRPITRPFKQRLVHIILQEGIPCKITTGLPESFLRS